MTQEDRVLTDEQSSLNDDNTGALIRLDDRDKDDDNTQGDDDKTGGGARGPELKTLPELCRLRRNRKSAVTKYIGKLERHVVEESAGDIKTDLKTLKTS